MNIESMITPEMIGLSEQEKETLKTEVSNRKKELDNILNIEFKTLNRHNFKQCVDKMLGKADMLDSFVAENETETLNLANEKNKSMEGIEKQINNPQIASLFRPFRYAEEINKKFYKSMTWRATQIEAFEKIIKAAVNVIEAEKGIEIERIRIEAETSSMEKERQSYKDQIKMLMEHIHFLTIGKEISLKPKSKKDTEEKEMNYAEE